MREIKFRFYCEDSDTLSKAFTVEELANGTYDWHGDIHKIVKNQYTGLKDKKGMGLTEVYEGDIISIDGILKGSIYENNKEPTDIIIPQLGTKAWNDAYKEAVARGYDYSE